MLSRALLIEATVATLAIAASVLPNSGAAQANTALICTNLVSGTTWRIAVDFEKRTVDSSPARITDTRISWHDRKDNGNYTFDRRSGKLTVVFASTTGGYFLYDRCKLEN